MSTREKIVAAGRRALLEQGYEGTGLGPLLASVAVPKGSFYHFFPSKEAFAGAVLDAEAGHFRAQRLALFEDASLSPLRRIERHLAQIAKDTMQEGDVTGCLYGVLALAAPGLGDDLKGQLAGVFSHWQSDLSALIGQAQEAGEVDPGLDPAETAAYIIDLYEGAALRARAGDGAAFDRLQRFALATLRARAA